MSQIGQGTEIGERDEVTQSQSAIHAALELGIVLIDLIDKYFMCVVDFTCGHPSLQK